MSNLTTFLTLQYNSMTRAKNFIVKLKKFPSKKWVQHRWSEQLCLLSLIRICSAVAIRRLTRVDMEVEISVPSALTLCRATGQLCHPLKSPSTRSSSSMNSLSLVQRVFWSYQPTRSDNRSFSKISMRKSLRTRYWIKGSKILIGNLREVNLVKARCLLHFKKLSTWLQSPSIQCLEMTQVLSISRSKFAISATKVSKQCWATRVRSRSTRLDNSLSWNLLELLLLL